MRRFQLAVTTRFAVVALVAGLASCSGGSSPTQPDQPPEDRLAEAKASLDAADFIGFKLHATALPDGVEGLLSATGTGTHAPAFTGEVQVQVQVQSSVDLTAPVVAIDGTVYAKLPFAGWSVLDPANYGAPDPADLMARDGGISSLVAATTEPREGQSDRVGDQIYTAIDGNLSGAAMQRVFPAAGSGEFAVNYRLSDDNDLAGVQITGPFYPGPGVADVTYLIDVDVDAASVDIRTPI